MTTATMPNRTGTLAERLARIADPGKRWDVTARTMRVYLATVGEVDKELSPEWREQLAAMPPAHSESDYWQRMIDVRANAVDQWTRVNGSNCTEGTDRFLATFGLDPLECSEADSGECDDFECRTCHPNTRKRVTLTVTITLTVDNDADEDDTENDVRQYLRVDASRVDDVEDDPDVEISDVYVETMY